MNQVRPPWGTWAMHRMRPVGEVGAGHEADLFAAAAAEAERVGHGEADEGLRVVPRRRRGPEPVQVHVEGRGVVEGVDPVAFAAGDDHGVADPAPAVADADAERGVGGDGGGDDGVAQHLAVVELGGAGHAEVVAGAAADERHLGADDPVGAPHDLRLVAGEPVGEEQQHPVGSLSASRSRQPATSAPASRSRPAGGVGGGGGDLEARRRRGR